MSDNNEPLDLQKIETRLKAATPGPWKEYKWEIHPVLDYGASGNDCHAICTEFYGPQAMQNRVLVANAPTDIAALVAEVKRLREREVNLLAWAKQRVKDYTYYGDDHFIGAHTMEEVVDYIETNGEGW